jgi:hypothetical protein
MRVPAGFLLLSVYAVPLFFPPHVPWPVLPAVDDGLLQRIFPEIPRWWIIGRLSCLIVGAALVAMSVRFPLPLRLRTPVPGSASADEAATRTLRALPVVALALAFGHAVSGLYASQFSRTGETLYLLFLCVPAIVLACTEVELMRTTLRVLRARVPTLLAMPAVWLAWSIPVAWRSPRAASIVDGWMAIERLEQVARGSQRLVDSAIPGFPNAHMLFEGAALYGPADAARLFGYVQVAHFFWTAVCAVAVGFLLWQLIGRAAAVIAQAVFLFSP